MSKEEPKTRGEEIKSMLSRIPIELLEQRALELLSATRHVSQGRDLPMVEEPDNAIRAKIWLACVEQEAGKAAPQRPVEPPKPKDSANPQAGELIRAEGKGKKEKPAV